MTDFLIQALEEEAKLSEDLQNQLAEDLMDEIEGKALWDRFLLQVRRAKWNDCPKRPLVRIEREKKESGARRALNSPLSGDSFAGFPELPARIQQLVRQEL